MSIYQYTKELEKLTNGFFKQPLMPEIIVRNTNSEEPLLKLNNEKELDKRLIELSEKKNICVDYRFWNYKYNSFDQLSSNFREEILDKIDVVMENVKAASYGYFLYHIILHEILVNTYTLNKDNFIIFLNEVNIDRNVMSKLLISYGYKLPITGNYFLLLKRLFHDYRILDLIFGKEECYYSCQQIYEVLTEIEYGGINDAYLKITSNPNYSFEMKLKYIKCLLETYNDMIDQEKIIYYSVKNSYPLLGLWIYKLDIEGPFTNIYYEILNLFTAKGGVRKLIILDDEELNYKIQKKIN
jgi:hypothetical protein